MNIIFMGTPDFAVAPLKALVEQNSDKILAVVCNTDRPVGRKQILTPPPVKEYAKTCGIPVLQYDKIRVEGVEDLKKLNPDLIITCAFGQILSKEILDIPKYGVFNIHASILPKYRGASPIHYAILNGEDKTGVTIMKTDEGIDTGDIILSEELEIGKEETCGELFDRLSVLGSNLIIKALNQLKNGEISYVKQDNDKATLTKIIKKEHAKIDFNLDAVSVVNTIRAFNPAPIAYTFLNGQPLKIYKAKASDGKGKTGEVIANKDALEIACGTGSVIIETLQKAGGKPMNSKDFLRGNQIELGYLFENV